MDNSKRQERLYYEFLVGSVPYALLLVMLIIRKYRTLTLNRDNSQKYPLTLMLKLILIAIIIVIDIFAIILSYFS